MKLRPNLIVEIAQRHLPQEEFADLTFILARCESSVDELADLARRDYADEDDILNALRAFIRKYRKAPEFIEGRPVRKLLRSIPPSPPLGLSFETLRKLDDLAVALGSTRDAVMRAALESIAMLPELAKQQVGKFL